MDIQTAKQIRIADFLHSLGYSPVKQQGINLWYKSPLREEAEASFKVNTERNQWYDLNWRKENVVKPVSPTTASGTLPSPFPMYRMDMKSATAISRAVSPQRKSPTSDNQGKRGIPVMYSRGSWITSPF